MTEVRIRGIIYLMLALFVAAGCGKPFKQAPPVKSPNGTLTLVTRINQNKADPTKYLCVQFSILNAQGKVLHQEQTGASATMRWSMKWQGNDSVMLKSADIGNYVWKQQPDGTWKKITGQ